MDLLQFERKMPDEAKQIRSNIAKMVKDNNLLERVNQWHIREEFPKGQIVSLFKKAGDLMRFDTVVDERYGCVKASYLMYGLFSEALEEIDSGLRSFLPSVTKGLVRYAIYTFGSEEQKEKYLPLLSDGSLVGCFALTGAHGGSDPKWMTERASIVGDTVVLNGNKNWITNGGGIADLAIVWMQTGEVGDHKTIRGFIVENGTEGFKQHPIKNKIGLRASNTGSLSFQDCTLRIKDSLLPGTIKGLGAAYDCLNQARYSIGWGAIGIVKACFKEAKKFATEVRQIHDDCNAIVPLAKSPVMKLLFTEIGSRLITMQTRAWNVAELIDEKGGITRDIAEATSYIKKANVADAKYAVDVCRKIMGANALLIEGEKQIPRHFLNIPVIETYEGTEIMHSFILGEYFTR